jgi:hypothetical protein
MNAAVDRLLDDRERQGLPRHVADDAVLATVAALLASHANERRTGTRRPSTSSPTPAAHALDSRHGER